MKEISASQAARHLSKVLDDVDRGQSFVILRRGKAVARIVPISRPNGAAIRRLLKRAPVDPYWADELRELRASLRL